MSWLKRLLIFSAILHFLSACGVKGDPLPPERPAELGRGRPTYQRATEKLQIESTPDESSVKKSPAHDRSGDEDDDDE